MKYFLILIALLALSFAVSAQSDRVKTVETRDSASMILFNSDGTGYDADDVQEAFEWLDFNAGDIFYISTTGDNSTGKKGYPNKPFTPVISLDSSNNSVFWLYPGEYLVGQGQMYNYPLSGAGSSPPSILYANSSNLQYINTGSHGWVYRTNGTTTSNASFFEFNALTISDIGFFRSEDFPVTQLNFKAKTLSILDNVSGGGTYFNFNSGNIEIDSLYTQRELCFLNPRANNNINIKVKNSLGEQSALPATNSLFYIGGSPLADMSENSLINIEFENIETNNFYFVGRFGAAGYFMKKSKINTSFTNINVLDSLSITDTIPSSTLSQNSTYYLIENSGNYIDSSKYRIDIKTGNISQGMIFKLGSTNNKFEFKQGIVRYPKTRSVSIEGVNTTKDEINLSAEHVISEANSPITLLITGADSNLLRVSGKWETTKTGLPVIYSASDFIIESVQLINDGVTPAIIAPTKITVYVRGDLYMNSDSLHPNVTFVKLDYGYTNPINDKFESTQIILDSLYSKAVGTSTYTAGGALSIGLTDIKITGLTPGIEEKFSVTDSTITYLGDTAYLAVEYSGTVELSPVALGTYLVEFTPYQNSSALQYGGSDVQIRVDASEQWFLPFGNKAVVQAVPGDEFSIRYRGTAGTPSNLRNLSFTVFRL